MAITRRQFVSRLAALAAAAGIGQFELDKLTEALAHGGPWASGNWTNKPKVVWVHGAECTGCSTSLLSLFEDVRGSAVESGALKGTTTLKALDLAVGGTGDGTAVTVSNVPAGHPYAHQTLKQADAAFAKGVEPDAIAAGAWNATSNTSEAGYSANIADVLIDFINLEYHETVNGMAGDLAYQTLTGFMTAHTDPFILVVEGGVQRNDLDAYWNSHAAAGGASWCSVGQNGTTGAEAAFDAVVYKLANQASCAAVVTIGQCASFGGYPACKSVIFGDKQSPSYGVSDFFTSPAAVVAGVGTFPASNLAGKVVKVPGCPPNPWWFILTVVGLMVDLTAVYGNTGVTDGPLGILHWDNSKTQLANTFGTLGKLSVNASAVDRDGRLQIVYPQSIHGGRCPNYQNYQNGVFAAHPGEKGCLMFLGCKGPATKSLCPLHGWNSTNPHNSQDWENGLTKPSNGAVKTAPNNTGIGNFCISAGAPCMGCTEHGYPDAFVPFVVR